MARRHDYKYVAFLAHSSPDKEYVKQIYSKLTDEYQLPCFYDEKCITPGQDFDKRIPTAIGQSAFGLFFYGSEPLGEYFREEIGMWKREASVRGVVADAQEPVTYVLLPSFSKPDDLEETPETKVKRLVNDYLRRCNRIDLRKDLFDPTEFGKLVDLLRTAAIQHTGAFGTRHGEASLSRSAPAAPVVTDLTLLCNRHQQIEAVSEAIEEDLQSQHRPVVVLVRGEQNQKPQRFVERVLKDLLPDTVGNRCGCFQNKIKHDIASETIELPLTKFQTEWMKSLRESAVLEKGGSASPSKLLLEEALQRLNEVGAVVIQTTIFLTSDGERTQRLVKRLFEFYAQSPFQELLRNPLIVAVCLVPNASRPPSIWSRLFGLKQTSDLLSQLNFDKTVEQFDGALRVVQTEPLGNVREEDVIRWAEDEHVTAFCPNFAQRNFNRLIFEPWRKEYGQPSAPMEEAIEDLQQLLADCCQSGTNGD